MDFNQSFQSYTDLNGARCQTVGNRQLTQREAAIEAVKCIGLRQIREMDMSKFGDMKQEAEMFACRLRELKNAR